MQEFRKWNRKYPRKPAHEMARQLLHRWGVGQMDYNLVDPTAVHLLMQDKTTDLLVANEAMIAVAFAAVKLRGCCDRKTKEIALNAIKRERLLAATGERGLKNSSERVAALDMLASALERVPDSPP